MVKGVNPLRFGGDESDSSSDWIDMVTKYFVPGMLVAAVIAVALIQLQDGGGIGGDGGSIFKDIGSAMFNLGGK
jgi:hypothetical protein